MYKLLLCISNTIYYQYYSISNTIYIRGTRLFQRKFLTLEALPVGLLEKELMIVGIAALGRAINAGVEPPPVLKQHLSDSLLALRQLELLPTYLLYSIPPYKPHLCSDQSLGCLGRLLERSVRAWKPSPLVWVATYALEALRTLPMKPLQ